MGTTRVFEGQDLSALRNPFHNVIGKGNGPCDPSLLSPLGTSYGGLLPVHHVHLAPIKGEQGNALEEDEEGEEDGEGEEKGGSSTARKRRPRTGPRLPGLAELDGEVQALAERERNSYVMVARFDGRRGSGGSSRSNCSTGSCDSV